jgi:hypothetical protein
VPALLLYNVTTQNIPTFLGKQSNNFSSRISCNSHAIFCLLGVVFMPVRWQKTIIDFIRMAGLKIYGNMKIYGFPWRSVFAANTVCALGFTIYHMVFNSVIQITTIFQWLYIVSVTSITVIVNLQLRSIIKGTVSRKSWQD